MIFKSPLRRRIEKRISEIIDLKTQNVMNREGKHHLNDVMKMSVLEMTHLDIELKALKRVIGK
jgi:hypothetical protein